MNPTETPRISVVLSVYNGARYLRAAIDSILAQTFEDFELIVIDDGSTDETSLIFDRYEDRRLVRIRNSENLGPYRSRNRGIAAARGEYLAGQDADDMSLPQRLAKQVAFLDSHRDIVLVGTQCTVIDEDSQSKSVSRWPLSNEEIQKRLLEENCFVAGSVMLRQGFLGSIGVYDESLELSADYDLWLRLAEKGELANLPDVLYCWRAHSDSLGAGRPAVQKFCAALAVQRAVVRRYGDSPGEREKRVLALHYLKAGLAACAANDEGLVSASFSKLDYYCPRWFDDQQMVRVIGDYAVAPGVKDSIEFAQRVMHCLSKTTANAPHLRYRIWGQVYASLAFANHWQGNRANVRKCASRAIRHDPSWLLNAGIRSILFQAVTGISLS